MPVKFQKSGDNLDMKRPHSTLPPEQLVKAAGIRSGVDPVNCYEPVIQHKKRVAGPIIAYSTDFYEVAESDDAYVLLGNQDKFSNNVKYRSVKPATKASPKQKKIQPTQTKRKVENAPVVDTKEFTELPTPLAPRSDNKMHELFMKNKDVQKLHCDIQNGAEEKEKAVHMKVSNVKERQSNHQPKQPFKTYKLEGKENSMAPFKTITKTAMHDTTTSQVLKKSDGGKNIQSKSQETVMAVKKEDSDARRAMLYKAGLGGFKQSKKISEYNKQFTWKDGIPDSPVMKAAHIVYKSNSSLVPGKSALVPKSTEYSAQFKTFDDSQLNHAVRDEIKAAKKQAKERRSKSVGAKPKNQAATTAIQAPEKEKPAVPKVPTHFNKLRRCVSEYNANFQAPVEFNYANGTQEKARPQQAVLSSEKPTNGISSSWFAEVIELRKKAQEYRKRAQGTHFSRQHLVQIMAKQADLWDVESTAISNTISALSLATPTETSEKKIASVKSEKSNRSSHSDDLTYDSSEGRLSAPKPVKEQSEGRLPMPKPVKKEQSKGRLSTPNLVKKEQSRHHFDLTTPIVGGALLTAPEIRKLQPKRAWVSRSMPDSFDLNDDDTTEKQSESNGDDDDTLIDEIPKSPVGPFTKTNNSAKQIRDRKQTTTPTLGMPTRDWIPLRDDGASTDRPLSTHYIHSPPKAVHNFSSKVSNKESESPDIDDSKPNNVGRTYTKLYPRRDDKVERTKAWMEEIELENLEDPDDADDVLSVRSFASSASLASDVLARTQKRANYWDTRNIATH